MGTLTTETKTQLLDAVKLHLCPTQVIKKPWPFISACYRKSLLFDLLHLSMVYNSLVSVTQVLKLTSKLKRSLYAVNADKKFLNS